MAKHDDEDHKNSVSDHKYDFRLLQPKVLTGTPIRNR